MKDCVAEPKVVSLLPDFARNNHGNLAEQQRGVGPQRGADTAGSRATAVAAPDPAAAALALALALAQKHTCTACHGTDTKIVGPGFKEIAGKYAGRSDAEAHLAAKIRSGGQGVWGTVAMPAQSLSEADARTIAQWLAGGAKK